MSGSNGQALLIDGTEFTGSGDVAGNAGLVDMVGYGTGNNTFEGATSGVSLTAGTAASRDAVGTDTDNNADDFTEPAPDPQNSGGAEPAPAARPDHGHDRRDPGHRRRLSAGR